jgi:hypothetical protein
VRVNSRKRVAAVDHQDAALTVKEIWLAQPKWPMRSAKRDNSLPKYKFPDIPLGFPLHRFHGNTTVLNRFKNNLQFRKKIHRKV